MFNKVFRAVFRAPLFIVRIWIETTLRVNTARQITKSAHSVLAIYGMQDNPRRSAEILTDEGREKFLTAVARHHESLPIVSPKILGDTTIIFTRLDILNAGVQSLIDELPHGFSS